jgi:hypothetical protein
MRGADLPPIIEDGLKAGPVEIKKPGFRLALVSWADQ